MKDSSIFSDSSVSPTGHPLFLAYPAFIDSIVNGWIYWKDKTKMPLHNEENEKLDPAKLSKQEYEKYLNETSAHQMVVSDYPYLKPISDPPKNFDPGRARNSDFMKKIYGGSEGEVRKRLKRVVWLRKKVNRVLMVNGENGAAETLQKISDELDKLPQKFLKYLDNPAGTFVWRPIAGTKRLSAHSFAIAIDINVDQSHYWRSSSPDKTGHYKFKNWIPFEIVEIFERNGWIWGGRWYHYDTMHFEYRPEIINTVLKQSKDKPAKKENTRTEDPAIPPVTGPKTTDPETKTKTSSTDKPKDNQKKPKKGSDKKGKKSKDKSGKKENSKNKKDQKGNSKKNPDKKSKKLE